MPTAREGGCIIDRRIDRLAAMCMSTAVMPNIYKLSEAADKSKLSRKVEKRWTDATTVHRAILHTGRYSPQP